MTVRKGDTVLVIAGKDRGKRGTVDRVEETKRGLGVVVPGLNMAKRHMRSRTRSQQAGILDLPVPIDTWSTARPSRAAIASRTAVAR